VSADQRETGILTALILACVWLAYSGPGYRDSPGFFSFLILLVLMLPLFLGVFQLALPGPGARYAAGFAVAWYGLSPANAATLVDLTRRPIVWSALGLVAGLVLYQWRPGWRKYGIYLLPVAAAACVHRATLVFAPLLFLFVFLAEKNAEWRAFPAVLLRCVPALLLTLPSLLLVRADPPIPGDTPPVAAARALTMFLAPFGQPAPATLNQWGGLLFIVLLVAAVTTAFWRATRLVSFGLWWFLVLLVVVPGEPLPACIGLALGASLALAKAVARLGGAGRWLVPIGCACLLIASALASEQQIDVLAAGVNQARVFRSRDPNEWLGLSVFYYQSGKHSESIRAAATALRLKPDSTGAYDNMGFAFAALEMWDQAVQAAQAALKLKPDDLVASDLLARSREQQRLRSR